MNYRVVANITGKLLFIGGIIMILPLAVAFVYGEKETYLSFIIPIVILLLIGSLLQLIKAKRKTLLAKEGFVICGIGWIALSLFGAIPFVLSGTIPNYINAFFESVSGFTGTGATVMTKIEGAPMGILFWRSLTSWIGGMGVLTFLMAIVPQSDGQSINLMRAEVTGVKADKIVSKMSNTVRILYGMYFALTLLQTVILMICGLSLYDAVVTAFATAGTGGFSVKDASIAGYGNIAVEYVCAIFMVVFSINFNLYFLLIMRKVSAVFRDEELRTYFIIMASSVVFVIINVFSLYSSLENAFRDVLFTVTSIASTTGFVTADFEKWPTFSKIVLLLLAYCGGCAGSTGGGFKVSRILLIFKELIRDIRNMLRPRQVISVKYNGKPVEGSSITGVKTFLIAHLTIGLVSVLLLSINGRDIFSTITAVLACISNIGPGMGEVGATGNYAAFSSFSKIVMCFDMLAGRLEIFPVLMLFVPTTWKKS